MVSLYDEWKYTKVLEINNPSSDDGVQVDCNVPCYPEMDKNFKDIRFTRTTGENVQYHLKSYTAGVSALVVLRLPARDTKIILHYGNSLVESASNPSGVYTVYDGFDDGNFSNNPVWATSGGNWSVTSGKLAQTDSIGNIFTPCSITNIVFEARIAARTYAGILFRHNGSNGYLFRFDNAGRMQFENHGIVAISNWNYSWVAGAEYDLKVACNGNNFAFYINNSLIGTSSSATYPSGTKIGLYTYLNNLSTFDNIVVKPYFASIPSVTILTDNTPKYEGCSFLAKEIDFNANVMRGAKPLTVQFTDLSVGSPSAWLWNFGDYQTSTDQNPLHEYVLAGKYDVSLTVTISGADYTETKYGYIEVLHDPPVADFSVDVLSGDAYHDVVFTDLSTNNPYAWYWEFGDGQISRSQNPSHRYQHSGTYTVALTSSNDGGGDTKTKTDYITVTIPTAPVANFEVDDTEITIPTTVHFTDLSTNKPSSWLWNFGDGDTSLEQNPVHTYDSFSTYAVSLIATNEGGSDTEIKTGYITVSYEGFLLEFNSSPITSVVTKGVRENGNLSDIGNYKDNFSGHITYPNEGFSSDFIQCSLNHLDMILYPKIVNNYIGRIKNVNIYNVHAPITQNIGKSTRLTGNAKCQLFYSVYSGADKVALIGKVYFPNGQPFPNVEAILYGNTYRQLVDTNSQGCFGDYYDPDTYYKLTCISENGVVYDSISLQETGVDVYTIVVLRRTKSNATFRQLHRKFI